MKKKSILPFYVGIINKSKTDRQVRLFDNALRSGINLNKPSVKIICHSDLGYLRLLTHIEKTGIKCGKILVKGLSPDTKKFDIITEHKHANGSQLGNKISVDLKPIKGYPDNAKSGILNYTISHETLWKITVPKNSEIEIYIFEK